MEEGVNYLPNEIWLEIFSHMNIYTLGRLSVCTKRFRALVTNYFLNRLHYLPFSRSITCVQPYPFRKQIKGLHAQADIDIYPLNLLVCSFDKCCFVFLGVVKDRCLYSCYPPLKIYPMRWRDDEYYFAEYYFTFDKLGGLTIDAVRISTFSYQYRYFSRFKIQCELFPIPEIVQKKKILAPFREDIIAVDTDDRLDDFSKALNKHSRTFDEMDLDTDYKKEDFPKYFPLL